MQWINLRDSQYLNVNQITSMSCHDGEITFFTAEDEYHFDIEAPDGYYYHYSDEEAFNALMMRCIMLEMNKDSSESSMDCRQDYCVCN